MKRTVQVVTCDVCKAQAGDTWFEVEVTVHGLSTVGSPATVSKRMDLCDTCRKIVLDNRLLPHTAAPQESAPIPAKGEPALFAS